MTPLWRWVIAVALVSTVLLPVAVYAWRSRRRPAVARYRLPAGRTGRDGWPAAERMPQRARKRLSRWHLSFARWRAELLDDDGVLDAMTDWEGTR